MSNTPHIFITQEALIEQNIAGQLLNPKLGAHVTFAGTVRNQSRGKVVLYLEYQAYKSMAENQLRALAVEANQKWNVESAIGHRLGVVLPGECSVVIAVASEHRAEAFEACRWIMDTLKETAPIWKKEFYEGGAHWIEGSDAVESPTE
jgi:molybdopterin synthase catalytic subunit